jgi:hypothetical protein
MASLEPLLRPQGIGRFCNEAFAMKTQSAAWAQAFRASRALWPGPDVPVVKDTSALS